MLHAAKTEDAFYSMSVIKLKSFQENFNEYFEIIMQQLIVTADTARRESIYKYLIVKRENIIKNYSRVNLNCKETNNFKCRKYSIYISIENMF